MYCKKCQYDLSGLSDNRCPECGKEYDPSDPSTYSIKSSLNQKYWISIGVILAVASDVLGMPLLASHLPLEPFMYLFHLLLLASSIMIALHLLRGNWNDRLAAILIAILAVVPAAITWTQIFMYWY